MRRTWIPAVLMGLALTGRAHADVVPPPVACAPWQDSEVHHGVTLCHDRVCHNDAQCGPGHCYTIQPGCVVSEPVLGTHRSRERVVGACLRDHSCVVGRCARVGVCNR